MNDNENISDAEFEGIVYAARISCPTSLPIGVTQDVWKHGFIAGAKAAYLRHIDPISAEPAKESQPDAFCQMLIKARIAKGLSIRDAEDGAHIPHGYLAQLEAGKYNQPSARALYNLAKLYETELKPLLVAGGLIVKKDAAVNQPSVKPESEESQSRWVPALSGEGKQINIQVGDKIKIYGKVVEVEGFYGSYNAGLEKWETIILTTKRGDPFERSIDVIEVDAECPFKSPYSQPSPAVEGETVDLKPDERHWTELEHAQGQNAFAAKIIESKDKELDDLQSQLSAAQTEAREYRQMLEDIKLSYFGIDIGKLLRKYSSKENTTEQ